MGWGIGWAVGWGDGDGDGDGDGAGDGDAEMGRDEKGTQSWLPSRAMRVVLGMVPLA